MKSVVTKTATKLFSAIILSAAVSLNISAQSSTVSPYSQFGLGHIDEQTSGFNRGLNGLGIGLREHNQVNPQNPASYSSIDSLTFIFDAGISGQVTNFSQNGKRLNANTASLDYVVAGFRVAKNVGMSFGALPFTTVGYNYSETKSEGLLKYTNTFKGSEGGIHQYFLGIGVQPVKNVSFGLNAAYLSGEIERTVNNYNSETSADTYSKKYTAQLNSYKLDFGLQVTAPITKKDVLTIGATYGLGHKLGADQDMEFVHKSTIVSDTTRYRAENAFAIPHTFGAGLSWKHTNMWKIGIDYSLQKWASLDYPVFKENGNDVGFSMMSNYYMDRHKVVVGGEYCRNENGRKFLHRLRYRGGISYTSPYYKIGNTDGPKELSVSAGFGLPIINQWNNRAILNISAQWVNAEAKGFIKENTFRINIGLTFNERWFMKWKLE